MKLYTHLNFGGNCEEAFRYYETHLGGKITTMMNQSQVPGSAAGDDTAIIHARMDIGDTILIGNDVPSNVFKRDPKRVHVSIGRFARRSGEGAQGSRRGGRNYNADEADLLCDSLQPGARPVRRVVVHHQPTGQPVTRARLSS